MRKIHNLRVLIKQAIVDTAVNKDDVLMEDITEIDNLGAEGQYSKYLLNNL